MTNDKGCDKHQRAPEKHHPASIPLHVAAALVYQLFYQLQTVSGVCRIRCDVLTEITSFFCSVHNLFLFRWLILYVALNVRTAGTPPA